jgi:hypothetical protein
MASAALQAKVGKAFTKVQKKFFDAGTTLQFLKPNDAKNDYLVVETYYSDWWLEYNNFDKANFLQVVDRPAFKDIVLESTHIRVKSPSDDSGPLYQIVRRTIEPPEGAEVAWRMQVDRSLTSTAKFTGLR